jgi:ribosomal protein S18 acetylase RimI-like enzyme
MTIRLRPALPGDEEFLFSVYASTRTDELALVDWDPAQKESFLRMQFTAQFRYYLENYRGAEYQVILLDGQPVGRLYVHRRSDEIRIMDIALLPAFQKQGIGSFLLSQILEEGMQKDLPVTIHVERFNPALHLYERLGFCLAEDKGVYYFMKWSPATMEEHEHAG